MGDGEHSLREFLMCVGGLADGRRVSIGRDEGPVVSVIVEKQLPRVADFSVLETSPPAVSSLAYRVPYTRKIWRGGDAREFILLTPVGQSDSDTMNLLLEGYRR